MIINSSRSRTRSMTQYEIMKFLQDNGVTLEDAISAVDNLGSCYGEYYIEYFVKNEIHKSKKSEEKYYVEW